MTRLLLLRHGLTDAMKHTLCGRMPGIHLNEYGQRQAAMLAEMLGRRYSPSRLISSPLDRAMETAAAIASRLDLVTEPDCAWSEMDYGDWTGQAFDHVRRLESWRQYHREPSTTAPPGGESLTELQVRIHQAMQQLALGSDGAPATVAVVSHAEPIRSLVALVLEVPLGNLNRFEIAPASITEITVDKSTAKVVRVNETQHLV